MTSDQQLPNSPANAPAGHGLARPYGWAFDVGQLVMTGVYIGCEWHAMAVGRIVAVHSGYCDVDVRSLHGGAPWIVQKTNTELRPNQPQPNVEADAREGAR